MRSKLYAWNVFHVCTQKIHNSSKDANKIIEESNFLLRSVNFVMVSKRLLFLDRKSNECYFQYSVLV